MNVWIALILGLIIGWAIELAIDYFYWRKRRLCPDDDAQQIRSTLEEQINALNLSLQDKEGQLEAQTTELQMHEGQVNSLTADLSTRDETIAALNTDIDAHINEINGLNGRVAGLETNLAAKARELEALQAELNGRDATIAELQGRVGNLEATLKDKEMTLSTLQAEINRLDTQASEFGIGSLFADGSLAVSNWFDGLRDRIAGLQGEVEAKDAELGSLKSDLGNLDAEANDLGIGSLFAGGGLALSGWIGNLRSRLSGLEGDVSAKDEIIAELRGELEDRKSELATLQVNAVGVADQFDSLNAQIDSLNAQLEERNQDLQARDAELGNLRAEMRTSAEVDSDLEQEVANLKAELSRRNEAYENLQETLHARDAELGNLRAETRARGDADSNLEAEISALKNALAAREADYLNLQEELRGRDVELGNLRAELRSVDKEANSLGIGSLFAGGGLAISNWVSNLRGRVSGLESDVESKDQELARLRGELEIKEQDIENLHAELNMQTAQVGTLSAADNQDEVAELQARVADLESQLAMANASLSEMHGMRGADYTGSGGLSMIWGLNTDASQSLEKQGIYTYNQLAATSAADVGDALTYAGKYYPEQDAHDIHGSWVEQARYAAAGDWDGLTSYQQNHFDWASLKDDLKKIWGIGPKIEQILNENGIYLFSQVASVPPDRITEILRRAGSRFRMSTGKLHETWPEQARLADSEEWEAFEEAKARLSWDSVHGKDS